LGVASYIGLIPFKLLGVVSYIGLIPFKLTW